MGVFRRFLPLVLVVRPIFRAVLPHIVRRLNQIIAQIGIATLTHPRVFGLERARLVFRPGQAGVLGDMALAKSYGNQEKQSWCKHLFSR